MKDLQYLKLAIMPRRKKNEQSPTRVPGEAPPGGDFGLGPLHGYDVASASNFSSSKGSSDRQKITQNMRDIFSRLDPEVIHMVLSEVDFKGKTRHYLEFIISAWNYRALK